MESLYLLVPLSVLLVLVLVGLFGWALNSGQLDDLEREGERIFEEDLQGVDGDQGSVRGGAEQCPPFKGIE